MDLSRRCLAPEPGASSRACSKRAQRTAVGLSALRGRLEPNDQLRADPHPAHRLSKGRTGPFGFSPARDCASGGAGGTSGRGPARSEEHTSELQSLMRISYAVFCLKKKK